MITPLKFVSVIRDEADAIRDTLSDYYKVEIGVTEVFERPIGRFTAGKRNRNLKLLHAPLSSLGVRLSDDERHYIFTRIFGRTIQSADDVTNIEALAFAKACSKYNTKTATEMVVYLLGDQKNWQATNLSMGTHSHQNSKAF